MNTAPINQSQNNTQGTDFSVSSSSTKEREGVSVSKQTEAAPLAGEVIAPPEVYAAGLVEHPEKIDVPPDMRKMGVKPMGANQSVSVSSPLVVLPISDDQILTGLHQPLISALHWLAIWSVRQLKRAHLVIKKVHGKIMRVVIK